jgi:hypothetical protein
MKVKELIKLLQEVNPEAEVFTAYDSNIVVNKPEGVEEIKAEEQIGSCWCSVHIGDVVILNSDR